MNKRHIFIVIGGLVLGLIAVAVVMTKNKTLFPNTDKSTEFKYKVTLANGEWEPYFSEKLEHYGVVSRIVNEAFAKEGVEVEFVFLPWSRGMDESAQGKWNGTMGWAMTPERKEKFLYSDRSIVTDTQVFFYLKNNDFDWKNINDLETVKIAAMDGYFYGDDFKQAEKDDSIKVERVTEEKLILKKLLAGNIDVGIIDKEVGYELINTLFSAKEGSKITHHSLPVETSENYLLLSKTDKENVRLMKLFNKGYQKLIDSGKVDGYWKDLEIGRH